MQRRTLIKRIKALKSYDDACSLAADLYPLRPKDDGSIAESFLSGWVNAAGMIEDKELDRDDWKSVEPFVLFEVKNYHTF